MAMIELVDYNEIYNADKAAKKTTRRSRRGGKKAVATPPVETKATNEEE
jgi:large subunit ribosomal protein L17